MGCGATSRCVSCFALTFRRVMPGHCTMDARFVAFLWMRGLGPLYQERLASLLLRFDMLNHGRIGQLLTLYLGRWMWEHGNIYKVLLSDHVCEMLEHGHTNVHSVAFVLCVWHVATG